MLNIMNDGYKKILHLFYTQDGKLHLRDIAKKTKLNENSAYRFLNKLVNENILKYEKKGNLKLFYLNKTKQVYSILTSFDVQKFEKLPHIRKTAINYFLDALTEKPIFVIVFGSTAKNSFKNNSDIDLLLITNNKISTKSAESTANAQSSLIISTFQLTYTDFLKELKLKEDLVIQSAINTGYPLINHILYYETLKNERI